MKEPTAKAHIAKTGSMTKMNRSYSFMGHPTKLLHLLEKEKELLTEADMMRLFSVERITLYRWRQKGIVPSVKISRNVYYIKQYICIMLEAKSGFFKQ